MVFAADDKFIYPACVMLDSFLRSNPGDQHTLWFLHHGVKAEGIGALESLSRSHGAEFCPVMVDVEAFSDFGRTAQFTVETWFRLLTPSVLPKEADRALWLDVDVVVRGSLADFYYQELGGNRVVGCPDTGEDHTEKLNALGCPEGSTYINAGVLLMNLTALREFTLRDYRCCYLDHREQITWFDQDVINCLHAGRIGIVPGDIYNYQTRYDQRFSAAGLRQLRTVSLIVHYTGGIKPWHWKFVNPAGEFWDQGCALTCGKGKLWLLRRKLVRLLLCWNWLPAVKAWDRFYNWGSMRKLRKIAKKLLKR